MKFTASRLSEGNKIFPAEIIIEPNGLTVKIPGLFSGQSRHLDYLNIGEVGVEAPLVGYSTITFFTAGTRVSVHGFTSNEVKQIKEGIEKGKSSMKNGTNAGGSSSSLADELKKLKDLADSGVITATEFEQQKNKILGN